jgi:hypothetical protein
MEPAGRAGRDRPPWRSVWFLIAAACSVAAVLWLGYLGATWAYERVANPLLGYRDHGHRTTVRAHDGCLRYWHDQPPRTSDTVIDFCGWRKPEGAEVWVPHTGELLVTNQARTRVVELVVFGMLPAGTARVRYTLPGGEVVEPEVRQHDELDAPAFWLHLRRVDIPVDLADVGGEVTFARFQIFDRAGHEIPVV